MWGGPPGPRMGVKMAPISGSFWPSWRVGMSLWSGGACFSLPLLHLNSAMGRERSDGKLKLAPPARHVGFFRSRSIKIGLILTPICADQGVRPTTLLGTIEATPKMDPQNVVLKQTVNLPT